MQLRHILVPTDQSDTSRNALRVALALAARAGARVSVMTTVGGQAGWGDADDPDGGRADARHRQLRP